MLTRVTASLRFLSPGFQIGDKYSVVQAIGWGGMGIVYEATHIRLGQRVAVKLLAPDLAKTQEALARFEREARAAAHIRSPHAARVFDVDALSDGTPYIVMEFLEGRDLADELTARGSLPVAEAVDYMMQACDAMAEAHRLGIVHRDLKPSNLFLANDGRHVVLKVLDFGISKVADEGVPSVTTTRSGLGTAVYMSPEQVRSAKHVDARSDVWALGVVLYEMLTGCQPFSRDTTSAVAAAIVTDQPEPLRAIRPDVPAALERVLLTALEKDRDRRFADAAELAAALAPFATSHQRRSSAPARAATSPIRQGVFGVASGSPPMRASIGARIRAEFAKWSRPPRAWILAGLCIGIVASAAVFRGAPQELTSPNSGATSQVLVPPLLTTTNTAASVEENAPAPPTEIDTAVPSPRADTVVVTPVDTRTRATTTPKASTREVGTSTAARSNSATRTVPDAPALAPRKDTAGSPSSPPGSTKKKSTHGLPPDPG
jgi:serine/threonine protein kinase